MILTTTNAETLLRKQRALKRELTGRSSMMDIRIAVLAASTPTEVVDLLELGLLDNGIRPTFYQSEYNKVFEEAVLDPSRLIEFKPRIVYIHTSAASLKFQPRPGASEAEFEACIDKELSRFRTIWDALTNSLDALVVQNNFDYPSHRLLGNIEATAPGGRVRFVQTLNLAFAQEARLRPKLLLNDLATLSSNIGLERFLDAQRWYSYKITTTPLGSLEIARSLAAIVLSVYGRSCKCLILDLDNTLWGGVIGDDGINRIRLGRDSAEGEAYTDFQEYCLQLRNRGVLLAVCSKNDEANALQGLQHPDSVLKREHFAAFFANWEHKPENIQRIASQLNIGLDSLVFVDDNPAERAIVAAQLPMVKVPDVGSDVTNFIRILERERYFETTTFSKEDLERAQLYAADAERAKQESVFLSYEDYLDSLHMEAEIGPFTARYLERITQLINKTNQYNLTTKRLTLAEVERLSEAPDAITLCGRLRDTFGDNGIVSIVVGRRDGTTLHIDCWLMSCRVLKRDMECAMLDALVSECQRHSIQHVFGYYYRTPKNGLVADHYQRLDFECVRQDGDSSTWKLDLSNGYKSRNLHIRKLEYV